MVEGLWARVGIDDPEWAKGKLVALRRLVLLTLACEAWVAIGYHPYSASPVLSAASATVFTLCAVLGWRAIFARRAVLVALVLEVVVIASTFPHNANHQYMAALFLWLILLADDERFSLAEGAVSAARTGLVVSSLQSVRWIVLVGLAWAGVMKIVSGYWFGGEYLAYRIAIDPHFAWAFGPMLGEGEIAELVSLGNRVGAGPFRTDSITLALISNLTWVAEILLPIGLLFAWSRRAAVFLSLGLMFAIQMGAREIFFAGMMVGGLLLFFDRNWLARVLPLHGAAYATWMFERAGIL